MSTSEERSRSGTLRDWLQLVRLPNLFTAAADGAAGFLFTHAALTASDGMPMALLIGASVLLYAGGVVLNDVFDYGLDCRERPERPLPSGRIRRMAAARLGWGLLASGIGLAGAASAMGGDLRPVLVAVVLALVIVAYDGLLKKTPLGPIAMGSCRGLNLLLGMSLSAVAWQSPHYLIAGALTVFVAGVTWFARTEAEQTADIRTIHKSPSDRPVEQCACREIHQVLHDDVTCVLRTGEPYLHHGKASLHKETPEKRR